MNIKKIVCFGDSTTAKRIVNGKKLEVYPHILESALAHKNLPTLVINAGVSGSNTRTAMERLKSDVCDHDPFLVVIQFGINDSWVDNDIENASSRIPLEEYSKNINKMISRINSMGARLILMTPNPIGNIYEKWRFERLKVYAEKVKEIAYENDIELIDIWKIFMEFKFIDELLLDSMHPNEKGHELTGQALIKTVIKVIK